METADQLARQIAVNSRRLKTLKGQLAKLAAYDPQRKKVERDIHVIQRAQDMWWNKLIKARGVTHYDMLPAHINAGSSKPKPNPTHNPAPNGKPATGSSDADPKSDPPHGMSYSPNKCHQFRLMAGSYVVQGSLCLTGSISLKPRNADKHVSSKSTPTGHDAQVVFDSVLASASGSLSYDSATNVVDASVASSLKVGNVSIGFGGSLACTGTPTVPRLIIEAMPKPVTGKVGEFDFEGAIGMKIDASVFPLIPPVPFRLPKPVRVLRPIPINVPVSPILVPKFIIDQIWRDLNGGGEMA